MTRYIHDPKTYVFSTYDGNLFRYSLDYLRGFSELMYHHTLLPKVYCIRIEWFQANGSN